MKRMSELIIYGCSKIYLLCTSGIHGKGNFIGKAFMRLCDGTLIPGNPVAALLAIMFMHSYGVMCGMGSSSFRAIMMFALRLLAPVVGRTYDVLSALALAEILLILDQPLYLYNSGFLFSFGAVLGMTIVKPVLLPKRVLLGMDDYKMRFVDDKQESDPLIRIVEKKLPDGALKVTLMRASGLWGTLIGFWDRFTNSLAIAITTLPVYACLYYVYPIHSLVLNLVVLPMMGVLMILGILCMLISAAGGYLVLAGKVPGIAVHIILVLYRWLCSGTALRRGFSWYMGHSEKWQVVGYIVLITFFTVASWVIEDNRWRGVAARVIKGVCDDLRKNIVDDHREDGRNIAGRDIAGSTATVIMLHRVLLWQMLLQFML